MKSGARPPMGPDPQDPPGQGCACARGWPRVSSMPRGARTASSARVRMRSPLFRRGLKGDGVGRPRIQKVCSGACRRGWPFGSSCHPGIHTTLWHEKACRTGRGAARFHVGRGESSEDRTCGAVPGPSKSCCQASGRKHNKPYGQKKAQLQNFVHTFSTALAFPRAAA